MHTKMTVEHVGTKDEHHRRGRGFDLIPDLCVMPGKQCMRKIRMVNKWPDEHTNLPESRSQLPL